MRLNNVLAVVLAIVHNAKIPRFLGGWTRAADSLAGFAQRRALGHVRGGALLLSSHSRMSLVSVDGWAIDASQFCGWREEVDELAAVAKVNPTVDKTRGDLRQFARGEFFSIHRT